MYPESVGLMLGWLGFWGRCEMFCWVRCSVGEIFVGSTTCEMSPMIPVQVDRCTSWGHLR